MLLLDRNQVLGHIKQGGGLELAHGALCLLPMPYTIQKSNILYDSTHIKLQNRKKDSSVLEVRTVVSVGEG